MFENDIFISYSHRDDEPWDGVKWVSKLHASLKARLGELLEGDSPKIFFDPQQRGNEFLKESLVERLRTTVALVSILSPSYFSSDWCPLELEAFLEACKESGGLPVSDSGRVFKVVKLPVPEKESNPPFRWFIGYQFYAKDNQGSPYEFGRGFGEDVKFNGMLNRLADDLSKLLRQIRGLSPQPFPEVRKGQGLVYLAMTSSDLREQRESLRQDLEHSGYEVLPQSPLPETLSEVETLVREQVARCSLSVHMIGGRYGSTPDESLLSYPEIQNKLAAERSDLTRLVWIAPAQPDDQRQKNFIDRLQTTPELQGRMEPLKISFEALKNEVHQTLEKLSQPSPGVQKRSAEAPTGYPEVYLIHDFLDKGQPELVQLYDAVFDSGCEVTTPLFEEDEAKIRLHQEESLRRCDAVVVFWGAGRKSWWSRQHSELLKSRGLGRDNGTPLILFYIAPPTSLEKDEPFRSHLGSVVRQPPGGLPKKLLADFFAELHKGRPEAPP